MLLPGLSARVLAAQDRLTDQLERIKEQPRDQGGMSVEWMLIVGVLFLVGVAVAAKYKTAVSELMGKWG